MSILNVMDQLKLEQELKELAASIEAEAIDEKIMEVFEAKQKRYNSVKAHIEWRTKSGDLF